MTPESLPAEKPYDLSKPILTLSRNIVLRSSVHADAEAMAYHANNRKIARNMRERYPSPYTVDNAHDWIAFCRNQENWPSTAAPGEKGIKLPSNMAIIQNDKFIGMIGIEPQSDVQSRTFVFGYWLGEEHWGQGIGTEVVTAFVKWIWDTYPHIVRLQADVYAWAHTSAKLLEKVGFVLEGRLKANVCKDGMLCDQLVYGLVREGVQSIG